MDQHQARLGLARIPAEILDEILAGNKGALLLDEEVDTGLVQTVISNGYAANLTDDEIEKRGRDPFLIAYGLVG